MKIGLISDTHGYFPPRVLSYFKDCDEIWHAGDIGTTDVLYELADFKPLRAVYGNIDGQEIRKATKENQIFMAEGIKVFMTHIGGYPGKYNPRALKIIEAHRPGLVICGHSHILKVIYDQKLKHLHINPGAAGNYGWHQVVTIITFEIHQGEIKDLKVIELGKKGTVNPEEKEEE